MSDPVNSSPKNYSDMVSEYAKIQNDAYTSQSAKSADITALKQDFSSYFDAHPEDSANKDKVLKGLDDMTNMAEAHEADTSHTDNANWDSTRSDMDGLIKELAPQGTDTSAIDSETKSSGSSANPVGGTQDYSTASSGAASGATTNFKGVDMVSMDAMVQKFPQLAPYKDVLQKAADQYHIPVQLLAAQAMQESHANPSENGGGMFQFIPNTWNEYGTGKVSDGDGGNYSSFFSKDNIQDQANAAAKYDADLLNQNGGDLNKMLRDYNGPIADGANSEYQTQIGKWMKGIDGYEG